MFETQNVEKTLEVKIRMLPGQERQDQRDVSRVFLSKDALLDLRLQSGQPCFLWRLDDECVQRKEAIAWHTTEKNLNKNVVLMFKAFRELCNFRLEDRIAVAPAGNLQAAEVIVLREISGSTVLGEQDRPHWEWYMSSKLRRAETIFRGMTFDISLDGPKRSFIVDGFMSDGKVSSYKLARYSESSIVKIFDEDKLSEQSIPDGLRPSLQISGIVGIDRALAELNKFLALFDKSEDDSAKWRFPKGCGVLLHGAPGTGKSLVLDKISRTGWGNVFHIDSKTKSSTLGDMFKHARQSQPSIIIIDDIDSVVSSDRGGFHDMDKLLGQEMDSLGQNGGSTSPYMNKVVVIAATSRSSEVPRSLFKPGRFKREVLLPVPDADARKQILRSLAPEQCTEEVTTLLDRLGDRTHAYTAQDLVLLLERACDIAEERQSSNLTEEGAKADILEQVDIDQALLEIRPTAMHDITLQPPKVKWDEIGGGGHVKEAMKRAVETPLLYPDMMRRLGAKAKKGLLLYGPPGCSKTLSAQAMATEIGFNFFAVKGAELLNMYVGESERALREVFTRARAARPSIIFFDEIEAIGSKRDTGRSSGVHVLTTLLNEMDGIETLEGVTVLAATNLPQALDAALLRPGRFDDLLYVPPPDDAGREEVLRISQRKMDFADDVDISVLSQLTDGYSGAELVGICQAACDRVIKRGLDTGDQTVQIHMGDLLAGMDKIKRQITPELISGYKRWASGLKNGSD